VPTVHGAVDDGSDPFLGVVPDDGVLEDAFSCTWFADKDTKPSLLGVNLEDVKVALLVGEKRSFGINNEGISGESKVGSDHFFTVRD